MKTIDQYPIGQKFEHSEYGFFSYDGIVYVKRIDFGWVTFKHKCAAMYKEHKLHSMMSGKTIFEECSIRSGSYIPVKRINKWLKNGTLKPIEQ